MTATAHLMSGAPLEEDSVETLQQTVRDLESKASQLQEIQEAPDLYRAEEIRNIELRKQALDEEIASLQAHMPRLFKGKHKARIEDLRIDMKYLDAQLEKIASDRANYLDSLPSQVEQTARELELARRELAEHEPGPHSPEPAKRSLELLQRPLESVEPPRDPDAQPRERAEPHGRNTFYGEAMRPALFALMEARLRFLDGQKAAMALLEQMKSKGLSAEDQQKCRILYDYVVGLLCMEWFPGDPDPLITDLRDRVREWKTPVESDDAIFELALANGLMIMPLQVMSRLEQSLMAGDVRHRMREIERICPGALESSERKCVHVRRIADADWLRNLAEKGLERLNQIRR